MNVLVTIPIEIHKSLVDKCDAKSAEYLVLKNGVIGLDEEKTTLVTILCESERANKLVAWVKQVRPDVANLITVSPGLSV